MRCSSTVSAPVQHCCAPLTAHHSRYIAVQLLTNQVLYFVTETKSRAKDVYAQICIYLGEQGMLDCELFGLAIMCDGEYLFVDPDCKLSKYAPKNWKSSSSNGLDLHGKPVFVLHFRVQFYVESPLFLRDDVTRHNYYLQLRDNALSRGHVAFTCSDELLLLLAGYALQVDYGDYNESEHKTNYFQLERYFPKELIARNSQITKTAIALHKENHGLTPAEAEMQYIKESSSNDFMLLSHNVHLYKLKSHKRQELCHTTVWLAICARGIQIYEDTQFKKSAPATFLWNNIGKLCFDRKKFEIRALSPSGKKMTYYTSSDEKSKLLLFLCRITHQFTMSMQARLQEAKRREEEEERKDQRASFAYSRGVSFDFSTFSKENRNGSEFKDLRSDQRISVISNTSSNTTSGIVSDRVQSLDESEDDLEMEVMINSPPGDSVESLALEHLRDGNQEVDASVVTEAPESDIQRADETPSTSMFMKKSPHSGRGGPTTPATTDGSQCSSSCSTVVVAGPGTNSSTSSSTSSGRSGFLGKNIHGRNSTTSSLELDYSHTAQNSAASESVSCLELNLSTQNDQFVLQAAKSDSETQDSETQDHIIKHLNFEMSNFILGKINQITRKSTFGGEVGSDTESLYSVFNVANSNTYGRCISLGNNENTRQCEVEYSDRTQNGNGSDVDTASSGIFTLPGATEPDLQTNACSSETSGIYGLVSSTVDTSSVSECCGVYAILEPMRNRSGSNASCVSASRSFHGDGSDPSDARMGTLLSAAELSDLIVGKAHNSGTYPSRSTVSHTLDSDSDYVTLPPPPRLPPRNETSSNLKPGQLKPTFSNEENGRYLGSETSDGPNASGSLTSRSLTKRYPNDIYHDAIGNAVEMQGTRGPGPTEEAAARFITTKPHISMITHSNVPPLLHTPNFACPTNSGFHLNYNETNTFSDVLPTRHVNKVTPLRRNGVENGVSESSFSSISILPETNERKNLPPSSGGKLNASKSAAILPIVGNNNYLDVYASRARSVVSARRVTYHRTFSPVPQFGTYPGQPSPVQPPLATVYTSQVARSQIEQFKQQLYSDVDYVIYPMKDPAISKQEYMDAKQGSLLAAMAAGGYPPPPPYPSAKSHLMYRSTPNVGSNYLPIEFVNGQVNRSANQFWPCKAKPPTSPMYSVTGPSKSSHGLRYDAVGLSDFIIPHSLSNVPGNALNISRTKSDDNILNASKNCSELTFSYPEVKHRRCQPVSGGQCGLLPATPTSDTNFKKSSSAKYGGPCTISGLQNSRYEVSKSIGSSGDLSSTSSATKMIANDNDSRKIVDIHALIEKSKNLDLPLISALCNDRSLIRQTNAFVMPKHPVGVGVIGGLDRTRTSQTTQNWTTEAKALQKERAYSFAADNVSSFEKHENRIGNEFGDAPLSAPTAKPSRGASLLETLFSVKSSKRYVNSSKLKYPVSGLSTTQISKPHKKLSSAHVHPKDSKGGDAGIIRTVKINTKTSAIKKNKDPLVP